jgi:hypothetical protein
MNRVLVLLLAGLGLAAGQAPEDTWEKRPAIVLNNDKLEFTVLKTGGTFASIVLKGDPSRTNPLWNPVRFARESGKPEPRGGGLGHFLCVDGFGPVSREEQAAGLSGHGEAHGQELELKSYARQGGTARLEFLIRLPLVQEEFTRVVRMVDGENVVYVSSELRSLLAFDRPVCWAEHATIGSPFLKPGVTVVDTPAGRSQTRPYEAGRAKHRYVSGQEFTWPAAPGVDGKPIDLRAAPLETDSLDHTTSVMDPSREYVYVTALEPEKRLIVGWVFKAEEFPWLQTWESYPPSGMLARGLEFSTQPFDVPRREAISANPMFGRPTYRWLPARSGIRSGFLMFFAQAPEGMIKVDDVRLEGGELSIFDRKAGKKLTLKASLTP